jgi:hypothetical protein
MNSYVEAQERIPTQREKILNALINAGSTGVTNTQLSNMCIRWNSRMGELYAQGYKIDTVLVADGVYRYILREQPKTKRKPKPALSLLLGEIKDKYDDIICADDLKRILEENSFMISRKGGTYKSA